MLFFLSFTNPFKRKYKSKTVIIGAGIFGMISAILAADRGEDVVLLDKYFANRKFNNYRLDHDIVNDFEKILSIVKRFSTIANRAQIERFEKFVKELGIKVKQANSGNVFYKTVAANELIEQLQAILPVVGVKLITPDSKDETISITVDESRNRVKYKSGARAEQNATYNRLIFADGANTSATKLLPKIFKREELQANYQHDQLYNFSVTFKINVELLKSLFPGIDNPEQHLVTSTDNTARQRNLAAGKETLFLPMMIALVHNDTLTIQGKAPNSFANSPQRNLLTQDWALQQLANILRVGDAFESQSVSEAINVSNSAHKGSDTMLSISDVFGSYAPQGEPVVAYFPYLKSTVLPTKPQDNVFIGGDAVMPADYTQGAGALLASTHAMRLDQALRENDINKYWQYIYEEAKEEYPNRLFVDQWVIAPELIQTLIRSGGLLDSLQKEFEILVQNPKYADNLNLQYVSAALNLLTAKLRCLYDINSNINIEIHQDICTLLEIVIPKINDELARLNENSFELSQQDADFNKLRKNISVLDNFCPTLLNSLTVKGMPEYSKDGDKDEMDKQIRAKLPPRFILKR